MDDKTFIGKWCVDSETGDRVLITEAGEIVTIVIGEMWRVYR